MEKFLEEENCRTSRDNFWSNSGELKVAEDLSGKILARIPRIFLVKAPREIPSAGILRETPEVFFGKASRAIPRKTPLGIYEETAGRTSLETSLGTLLKELLE